MAAVTVAARRRLAAATVPINLPTARLSGGAARLPCSPAWDGVRGVSTASVREPAGAAADASGPASILRAAVRAVHGGADGALPADDAADDAAAASAAALAHEATPREPARHAAAVA